MGLINPAKEVEIIDGKYRGRRGLAWRDTGRMYEVTLIDEEVPILERIIFDRDDVARSFKPAHQMVRIGHKNVRQTGKTKKFDPNEWSIETGELTSYLAGKTRAKIEKELEPGNGQLRLKVAGRWTMVGVPTDGEVDEGNSEGEASEAGEISETEDYDDEDETENGEEKSSDNGPRMLPEVEIIAGKYKGRTGVVLYNTPQSYSVTLIDRPLSILERLVFETKGQTFNRALFPYEGVMVRKTSARLTGDSVPQEEPTGNTVALMDYFEDMTREEVEAELAKDGGVWLKVDGKKVWVE